MGKTKYINPKAEAFRKLRDEYLTNGNKNLKGPWELLMDPEWYEIYFFLQQKYETYPYRFTFKRRILKQVPENIFKNRSPWSFMMFFPDEYQETVKPKTKKEILYFKEKGQRFFIPFSEPNIIDYPEFEYKKSFTFIPDRMLFTDANRAAKIIYQWNTYLYGIDQNEKNTLEALRIDINKCCNNDDGHVRNFAIVPLSKCHYVKSRYRETFDLIGKDRKGIITYPSKLRYF